MSVEKSKLPTLIESILRRHGGTIVTLGTTSYHFKPDAADRHVAQVEDDEHAERLLSIREGYREVAYLDAPLGSVVTQPAPQPVAPVVPTSTQPPAANTIAPVSTPEGGSEPDAGSEPEGNDKGATDEGTATTGDASGDPAGDPPASTDTPPVDPDKATTTADAVVPDAKTAPPTKEELVAAYQQKFGRKPHHQWSDEIIAAKLAEG